MMYSRSVRLYLPVFGLAGVLFMAYAFGQVHAATDAAPLPAADSSKGIAVVELFTSEGCSSCPPADALIEKVQQQGNAAIFILAFHVDYWNRLGWKDRFSDAVYSGRQRTYAGRMNLQSVYTPQVVVNGTSEFVGSDEEPITAAIAKGLATANTHQLLLQSTVSGNKVTVYYQGAGADRQSELVLALVQRSAQSDVAAGENAGRKLAHVQIVRGLQQVSLSGSNMQGIVTITAPKDLSATGWEVIGFVQHKTSGNITAAGRSGVGMGS